MSQHPAEIQADAELAARTDPCAMVVADSPNGLAIRQALHAAGFTGAIHQEPDLLMALGLVTQLRPLLVIATIESFNGQVRSSGAALRRIVPGATLLLTGSSAAEETADALNAGFDHYLAQPLNVAALRSTFKHEDPLPTPEPVPAPKPQRRCGPLGDVDLVDQVIDDYEQLSQLAMRLLSAQSGIEAIAFAPASEQVPPEHTRAVVGKDDQQFGFLYAPLADAKKLGSWADWLGHWMALGRHIEGLWNLALRDELTGLWNRRYFNRFLTNILNRAVRRRFRVTLLVFDIDNFKTYNDRYGHQAGDEILRETAKLLQSVVRDHDVVARIGGDEFAVIFWDAEGPRQPDSEHPNTVRKAADRFQRAICAHKFPKLLEEAPGTLTISAGLAGFPWDGRDPEDLLARADEMAMHSKQQGKNVVTYGPGAMQACTLID